MKLRYVGLGFLLVALFATGCGNDDLAGAVTGAPEPTSPRIGIPALILGLTVQQEDISGQIEQVDRSYLDSVGMFSLRENDLLRATLQIGRFNALARPRSDNFRNSIVGLLGSSKPLELRLGSTLVYSTSGNEQNVYLWFNDDGMFVLSVHRDYEFPRTLLRRIVDLDIKL